MAAASRMKPKVLTLNILVSLLTLVLMCAFFEGVVLRSQLRHVPLRYQRYLHFPTRVLTQSSKHGTFPRNYVLIVGDSNAVGAGDSLLRANPLKNGDFASQHLLHRLTGRDIISIGTPGAGSVEGIAVMPVAAYRFLNATALYRIEAPKKILVYFYEGNDLNDNLYLLERHFYGNYDRARLTDPDYFIKFIDDMLDSQPRAGIFNQWTLPCLMLEMARSFMKPETPWYPRDRYHFFWNRVKVAGRSRWLPNLMQSPALGLELGELRTSLYVFEQSLKYLQNYFPNSQITVIYIPSPLSVYELMSPQWVNIDRSSNGGHLRKVSQVAPASDAIASAVRSITQANDMDFLDTRHSLRAAARTKFIHGPRDWYHFNQEGYRVLANAIVPALK
jgi:hypothetical protein